MHALVLVDLQNAFCHPDGSWARRGMRVLSIDTVVAEAVSVTRLFRQRGWPIICTRMQYSADYADAGLLVNSQNPMIRELNGYVAGSHDAQLVEEIARELPSDVHMLTKTRYDPFVCTHILDLTNLLAVDRFFVAGVLTNVCVESFVRSAFDRDFQVTTLSTATGSYSCEAHAQALANCARHFGEVKDTETVLKELAAHDHNTHL